MKFKRVMLLMYTISAIPLFLHAQKMPIDTNAYAHWPHIEINSSLHLNGNGQYAIYSVAGQPLIKSTIVITSTSGKWQKEFPRCGDANFTEDGRSALVQLPGDSLGIVLLGTSRIKYITHVNSTPLLFHNLLIYYNDDTVQSLVLRNLQTGILHTITHVVNYLLDTAGNTLIIQSQRDDQTSQRLVSVNLVNYSQKEFWIGSSAHNLVFDRLGKRLAFMTNEDGNGQQKFAIWTYEALGNYAKRLITDDSAGINEGYSIMDHAPEFSKDGGKLLFVIKKNGPVAVPNNNTGVNIWNYKDKYLPAAQHQESERRNGRAIHDILDFSTHKITSLDADGERLILFPYVQLCNYALLVGGDFPDSYYKPEDRSGLYLVSTITGRKTLLTRQSSFVFEPIITPNNQFVVWFDLDSLCYRDYEVKTGITRNISAQVPEPLYDVDAAKIGRQRIAALGIPGYLDSERFILIYDRYDIWKVDLLNKKKPVNLTQGVGRKERLVFSLCESGDSSIPYDSKSRIVLAAYEPATKKNGFWIIQPGKHPELLPGTMDSYVYYIPRIGRKGEFEQDRGLNPVKAKNKDIFIVQRMSASAAPNLLVTSDFKIYKLLSHINPAASYNWLTSELVNWTMTDGKVSQGILYKPEDFNPKKKYPVIFTYYEKWSDALNRYLTPDYANARMDIPTYVSNGYLVFVPDIYYTPGHNGDGVVNSVVSAAKFLCQRDYVDSTKLGLMGHSFAGWETNYLITHSHRFAAAMEACGVSDQVSAYDELDGRQEFYEVMSQGSPFGIGVTPWTRPDLYMANSPVLNVGNVTTPLLMMHNKLDGAVPYVQGVEMFLAMKRAGKKVWMLEYDKGDHFVWGNDKKDYTIRMRQFFDYYLKGAPAPRWMVEGVPAEQKGIDDGLEPEPGMVP